MTVNPENPETRCEQSLKRAEQRIEDISIQTNSWCWETDENHLFTFFTANVERLTNLSMRDLLGSSRLEMAQNSDDPEFQAHAKDLLRHAPFDRFKYRRKNQRGQIRTIVVTGWPIFDETGNFSGYRGTGWDETEVENARDRQVRKEEQLFSEIERQRASLDTVLQNLGQSVIWFDKEGYIRLNNARTAEILEFDKAAYSRVVTMTQHLMLMAERGDFGEVDVEQEVQERLHRLCTEITAPLDYRIKIETLGKHLEVSVRPMPDGSRILTHTDVTAESLNALKTKQSDAKLKAIINNIDYGIVLMDSELTVEFANEKFCDLLGVEKQFLSCGPDMEEVFDKIRADKVFQMPQMDDVQWRQYVQKRREYILKGIDRSTERLLSDGRTVVENSVALAGGRRLLTFVDITALRTREALFEQLVNNIDYATLVIDENQNVELWNKKFVDLMSYPDSELEKHPKMSDVLDQMHAQGCTGFLGTETSDWIAYRDKVLDGLRQDDIAPSARLRADGKTVVYAVNTLPGGKRLMTYLDISEHTAREEKLREMQEDLKAANEMLEERVEKRTRELRKTQATLVKKERQALLGDLVASLCHELRNPLNALNTSMFIVKRRVIDDFPKLEKAFDRSERTIERCTNILDDLFEFALTGDVNLQPVDVENWLRTETGKIQIPKAFDVEFSFDLHRQQFNFDEKHMASAIGKIISNAAQAIADNFDPVSTSPKIKISASEHDNKLIISVADNGPGMDMKTRDSALEPLFSTRGFGVGLGLPIAEQTAIRHGGGLELTSVEGEGTTVSLWLPAQQDLNKAA